MHFKKLEIIGFKSFAEKTTLLFEPGITAIIGPNGCGKSNIFDAIRWVLGEQSIKSLRGSKMEDVIFSGTESKAALNLAEVSLTFSNETRLLPIDYDEVTITRRVFRSGESEYLLNKTQVRLKDVTELLLGTGIGAESYSLIEQGKIDLVLSSRPEDRRFVFDEAAGVTKYKSKKKEALRRLEDTDNNLLRVNDIITEVKRQINSLDRQVNKARRYKEHFENLTGLEVAFSKLQIKELQNEFDNLLSKIEEFKKNEADKNTQLVNFNSELHELRSHIQSTESGINNEKGDEYAIIGLLDKNAELIKVNQERIKEQNLRVESLQAQNKQVQQRLELNNDKHSILAKELSELSGSEEKQNLELKEKEKGLELLSNEIKNANSCINQAKKQILEIAQNRTTHSNDLSDLNTQIANFSARRRRLEIEKEKVSQEKVGFDDQIKQIEAGINTLDTKISGLRCSESEQKTSLKQSQDNLKSLEDSIKNLENEKLSLESQLEFLEKLKLKYDDIPEFLEGTLIVDKLPQGDLSGIMCKVKEVKRAESGAYRITCELKPIPLDTQKVRDKITSAVAKISSLSLSVDSEKNKVTKFETDLENIAQDIHQEEIELSGKKINFESISEQVTKLKEELEIIDIEYSEADSELKSLNQKEEELKKTIAELENSHNQNQALMDNSTEDIKTKAALREEITVAIARLTTELDSLEDRRLALASSVKLMQESVDDDARALERIKQEIDGARQREENLVNQNTTLEEEIQGAKIKREEITQRLNDLKSKYDDSQKEQENKEEKIAVFREEIDKVKNSIYELSMQDKDIEFKKSAVKERILQTYKVDLDEAPESPDLLDKDAALEEIEQLKVKVEKMGTVNLVAIEEHEELKQRFEFLTNQQNDLISAKESLRDAIVKINKTTKKLFLETFAKINEGFKIYFKLLFGGGQAQLILIDETDVLESGIEIIARPPGKKLQNVLLLSGGEKALSAIALIFAVFRTKPSPFCVLDEIDAALDESNVDRFNRLLQEFLTTSQFLVITHNKKTITAANVMYGITMQERGISSIVSAKLRHEKKHRPVEVSRARAAKK